MAKTLGAADANMLKYNQQALGDGGAAIAMYQAFDAGFKGESKPGMEAMQAEYARQQGTFNALMENKPSLDSVPLLEDTQLAGNDNVQGMEGLMKEVSGLYQEQAKILSRNKDDMGAQKKITEAAGYIQNIDNGNKQLAQINYGNFEINGEFNDVLNPTQQSHLQGVQLALHGKDQTGIKIEYPKEDGYHLKVTMPDGTIYDKNNPLPLPQGEFKNGTTAAMKFYNDKREKGSSASAPITKEGAANQFLNTVNELKSDGDPDKPATANEKMSMFFTDVVDDDKDLTYANAFASGNLPREFYLDANGDVATFDRKERGPEIEQSSKPAFDQNGNFQWTKEEATDYLRQKTALDHNMKNMSKWYGGAVADVYNSQYNAKEGIAGRYYKSFDDTDVYGTRAEINIKKSKDYTGALVSKSLLSDDGTSLFEAGKHKDGVKGLNSTFAGTDVKFAYKKRGDKNIIAVKIDGVSGIKGFNVDNPREYEQMLNYLNTNSKTIKGVNLGSDANKWVDFDGSSLFDAMLANQFGFESVPQTNINNNNNNRQGIRGQVDRTMPAPKI
jgi:hypothetical protein